MTDSKAKRVPPIFLIAIALIVIAWLFWSVIIEPDQLISREYALHLPHWPPALNGMRVAIITDLHVGSLHVDNTKVKRVVELTNSAKPDVILLLGDYVLGHRGNCPIKPSSFTPQLEALNAPLGVYAVLGNHDWWCNGKEMRTALEAAHIRVLENESVMVNHNKQPLWLVGIADLWTRKPDIEGALHAVPLDQPSILFTHNPDLFPDVPARVCLTVAGHTHGGQIANLGAITSPSHHHPKYVKGLIEEGGRNLFISTGIGTSVLPVRFGTPPEVSVLILSSETSSTTP